MPDPTKPEGGTPAPTDDDAAAVTFASQSELDAFVNAKIERAVKARLKNKPMQRPDADPDVLAQLDAANKRIEEMEGASRSELEKAIARAEKLAKQVSEVEEKAKAREVEFSAQSKERTIREAILSYAKDASVPGKADDFVMITRGLFAVEDDDIVAEDPTTGRKVDVKARLDAFRKEPGREIWNAAPAPGTGDRKPGQPVKPATKDWRADPAARERAAREELAKMRDRGPIVPTEPATSG